jgi:hypothetical protein
MRMPIPPFDNDTGSEVFFGTMRRSMAGRPNALAGRLKVKSAT